MEQRKAFFARYLNGCQDFKALCAEFGISEKTGYKWRKRFMEFGYSGLLDQSKKPKSSPALLDEDTVIRLISIKTAHPTWGPKKIEVLYQQAYPDSVPPSQSSIYRVLGKVGLIQKRVIKQVNPSTSFLRNRIAANEANDVWTVDFKGWWFSQGEKCLPLTIRDLKTKYVFEVRLMQSTTADAVKAVFEELFYHYGLPKVIRSDNGPPFVVTNSMLGLTTLSAWWMLLGIIPDRIDLGTPTQNGSHERMHGDLSREIQGKIQGGVEANQRAIDAWRKEYNEVRPHEALGMATPASLYRKSSIRYEGTPDTVEYPIGFLARKVSKDGMVTIGGIRYPIGSALRRITVGLQQQDETSFLIWLGEFPIGVLNTQLVCFNPVDPLKSS